MFDLHIHDQATLERAAARARERRVIIPTFAQLQHPERIPEKIRARLASVGLWDLDPLNLFRITWKNQPVDRGGGYGPVNLIELPSALTGVKARIVALVGKWFPTGAHKVGAAFGCLVPRLVTGEFDPTRQKAVWPSTGNYCRGGAYDSNLLGCDSIAILPEGMSEERFAWLAEVAGETIRTPGSESNVKEIFDKCQELERSGQDVFIFNQFCEFGNYLWHHAVTGAAMVEALDSVMGPGDRLCAVVAATGSAGTLASGDHVKERFPGCKIAACEALQCPTLLCNGYGSHRIEGIGDKHVPWIHNVRNTDLVVAIDDEGPIHLMRLFNEPAGREYLLARGLSEGATGGLAEQLVDTLPILGISGISNMLACIKLAKYFELTESDVLLTVATDSMEMYGSRVVEYRNVEGPYDATDAAGAFHRHLLGAATDHVLELTYLERKRIHNLKYFTWVEQQGKTVEELDAQWYEPDYWTRISGQIDPLDRLIEAFNARTGLLDLES